MSICSARRERSPSLLGKKGEITQLFEEFRTISADKKKEFGQKLNNLKNAAAAKIEERNSATAPPSLPKAQPPPST